MHNIPYTNVMEGLDGAFRDLDKLNGYNNKSRYTHHITKGSTGTQSYYKRWKNFHRTTAGKGSPSSSNLMNTSPTNRYEELRKRIKQATSKSDKDLRQRYYPRSDINPDSSKRLDARYVKTA